MWEETINRTCKVDWRHNIVSVYMILVWLYVSCCVVAIINESLTHSSIPADPFSHFTEHHQQHRHLSRYVIYSLWIAVSCLSNLVDSKVSIWFIENNNVVIIIVNIRLALLLMIHPNEIYYRWHYLSWTINLLDSIELISILIILQTVNTENLLYERIFKFCMGILI